MNKFLISITVVILVTGCVSRQPSRFYRITPVESSTKLVAGKMMDVGIAKVSVPVYMERPQIVTVKEDGVELRLAEFHRWAEPLYDTLQIVIAENISAYVKNMSVRTIQGNGLSHDYRVIVEVNRFDGVFDDKLILDAWWSIIDGNNKEVVGRRVMKERPIEQGYNDLVMKKSELVGELSMDIAKALVDLSNSGKSGK